jgi:HEAT repeat protein
LTDRIGLKALCSNKLILGLISDCYIAIASSKFIKLLPILFLTSTILIESISLPLLPRVRVAAASSIAQSQTNQATEIYGLIQQLKSKDTYVRLSAAKALGKIGVVAIPNLLPLLKDEDKNVRIGAIAALGNMGEPAKAAVPNLILLLQDKESRWRAIDALRNIGESAKSAIPQLMPLLKDEDEMIRFRAESALEKIGYKR